MEEQNVSNPTPRWTKCWYISCWNWKKSKSRIMAPLILKIQSRWTFATQRKTMTSTAIECLCSRSRLPQHMVQTIYVSCCRLCTPFRINGCPFRHWQSFNLTKDLMVIHFWDTIRLKEWDIRKLPYHENMLNTMIITL